MFLGERIQSDSVNRCHNLKCSENLTKYWEFLVSEKLDKFPQAWLLQRATSFPALCTGYTFSHALQQVELPTLSTVKPFPALCTGYTFSHALQQVELPALSTVALFPAPCTGYTFSRALQQVQLPAPSTVALFPALCTGHTFSHALQQVHFPSLSTVTLFSALCTGYTFFFHFTPGAPFPVAWQRPVPVYANFTLYTSVLIGWFC